MQKVVLFGVFIGIFFLGCQPEKEKQVQNVSEKPKVEQRDTTATPTYDDFGLKVDSLQVEEHRVKRNESLYAILDKFAFNPQEIYSITQRAQDFVDLDKLRPGQKYRTYATTDSTSGISHMVWQSNPIDYVVFDWQHDSLQIYKAARPLTSETVIASGTIDNSLYQTVIQNDTSPLVAYKMAEIFAWQIDFFGLRKGDSYMVLYDKQFIDGEYYGIGDVQAAKFTHRGETYKAYQFNHTDISGYFTETGKSVQKALLKAPFKYGQRISSRFSHSRFHPILKKRMPHYGVDYAAPSGTPVLSVGDGTVTEARYRGANGNIVKIKHNGTYRTAYLHLKGFARGIHKGAKVKQGQVIGYVGSTGRSTGSHLDYRLYRNNKPVNPLAVELPSSEAIPDSLMEEFERVRDSLDHKLQVQKDSVKKEDPVLTWVR